MERCPTLQCHIHLHDAGGTLGTYTGTRGRIGTAFGLGERHGGNSGTLARIDHRGLLFSDPRVDLLQAKLGEKNQHECLLKPDSGMSSEL